MPIEFRLLNSGQRRIVELPQMRRHAKATRAALRGGGLVAWAGLSGIGKTWTAQWLTALINSMYNPEDETCYRATHYEVGAVPLHSGNAQKHAIRSLHTHVLGAPMPEGTFKRYPAEALAKQLVFAMRRKRVRIVFVDEAGCLSLEAIRGMVLVRDVAELEEWTLSIVFIGMDDLPTKLELLPQIKRRLAAWCYFDEYDFEDTRKLLGALHPHFGEANEHIAEEAQFIYQTFGGFPGHIVPFLNQVDERLEDLGSEINLDVLIAVHELAKRDREHAVSDARNSYARRPAPQSELRRAVV